MKAKAWFVLALVAGGGVYAVKTTAGCLNRPDPDQRLAGRIEDMCEIARDGADDPKGGLRALGKYLGKHGGDLLKDFGDTVAIIERVKDDDAHDERARMARGRIHAPILACQRDWSRFHDAIADDPEAKEILDRAMQRLNRTLDILFGSRVGLRDLPGELERALESR